MQTQNPNSGAPKKQTPRVNLSGVGSFFQGIGRKIQKSIARKKRRRALLKAKIAQLTPKQLKKYKAIKRDKRRRLICRTLLCILTVLALLVVGLFAGCFVLFEGPSQTFGDLLTVSLLETSALKFVPHIYYDEAKMEAVIARNSVQLPEADTDTSLININTEAVEAEEESGEPIELHEVTGPTFRGYMMIVKDPSRVTVGICRDPFNANERGLELKDLAKKYKAVAAINGGGFPDSGGVGKGGSPSGLTISGGKVKYKHGSSDNITVGFDKDNKLIVGKMNATTAEKKGIRDCVTFGPALVLNGEPVKVSGSGSGLNPRSAIGQRADGAVLLLVIDGRQANSIGASISDLIKVMMEYEAVNACNLDGGSSSLLYYNGKYVNKGVVLTGSRHIPTAFVVR